MTQQEVYKRAIALDPSNSAAFRNLAQTMTPTECTQLEDGTRITQHEAHETAAALELLQTAL